MSIINDNRDKWIQDIGNIYACIEPIADKSREIYAKHNDKITDSQAMSWAMTGDVPSTIHKMKKFAKRYSGNEDLLNYIDNKSIQEAVHESYMLSVICNHLIYSYKDIQDPFLRSRVRVLTNMIWYNNK